MRHLVKKRTLSRKPQQRKALLKALASALFVNKRIETTLAKARELRPWAEKLITKARVKSPARIRQVRKNLAKPATKELFDIVAPATGSRQGGYTRIIKKGPRASDGALMAIVELVDSVEKKEDKQDKSAEKPAKTEAKGQKKVAVKPENKQKK